MKKHTVLIAYLTTIVSLASAEYTTFVHGGHTYRTYYGKDMRTWKDAYEFAAGTSIGKAKGYLSNINSAAENAAIFKELQETFAKAGYLNGKGSSARDGGGASYAWLGGNDIANEGEFFWASSTNISGVQFWTGGCNGHAVNSAYTNWGHGKLGKEPDNYGGKQNAVAMAADAWPLSGGIGKPGQWNDINQQNIVAFVVEYDSTLK